MDIAFVDFSICEQEPHISLANGGQSCLTPQNLARICAHVSRAPFYRLEIAGRVVAPSAPQGHRISCVRMALSEGIDKSTLLAKNCACSRPRVVDCEVFAALQERRVLDVSFGSRRLNLPAGHVVIATTDLKLLASTEPWW